MKVMQVMEVMEVTKAKPLRSLSVRPEFIEGFLSLSEKERFDRAQRERKGEQEATRKRAR